MIKRIEMTHFAQKQVRKAPFYIQRKIFEWMKAVEKSGLEFVRRIPGYHDEPLKGKRDGHRSIRLNRSYRAIYLIKDDGVRFVSIEEVNKHEY